MHPLKIRNYLEMFVFLFTIKYYCKNLILDKLIFATQNDNAGINAVLVLYYVLLVHLISIYKLYSSKQYLQNYL